MSGYKPSICFGDGVLFREGSAKVMKYINDNRSKGWLENWEIFYVVKNYNAVYDDDKAANDPNYVNELTQQITTYLNEMCTNKGAFPNLKLMTVNMNGYTMGESTNFSEVLKNACDVSTNVNIVALETTIRYPVFCMSNKRF